MTKPLLLSLLLTATPAVAASADAVRLTADEVARRAAATSGEVRARGEDARAAAAAVDQALAAYVPRLSGVARYTRLSKIDLPSIGTLVAAPGADPGPLPAGSPLVAVPLTFPVILDQYTAQGTLQIPISDYVVRLRPQELAARGQFEAASLVEKATRLRVARDARLSYYGWVRARRQVEVAQQAVDQARGHLGDAQHAADAGAASRADVLRVESQLASAELLRTRARSLVEVMDRQLRTLMHDDAGRPYDIGEDVDKDVSPATEPSEQSLIDEALATRLESRALATNAQATRQQARAVRAAGLPRLDAVGNATYANPNQRIFPQTDKWGATWDATLQVTWAPTDLFGTASAHRATQARADALEAERSALLDGLRMEVTQSLSALRESEAAVSTATRGLTAAEESYRVRRLLFQNGRATSVELTDAESELVRARLEVLNARVDLRTARIRLDHAVGRDAR